MAHIHGVYDTDSHFSIDPVTRQLKYKSEKFPGIVQYDHNSQVITFEAPRYTLDGHDMLLSDTVRVHYINIDSVSKEKKEDIYDVTDLQLAADDENVVLCSWAISRNATQFVGILAFSVRFSCTENGKEVYGLSTTRYDKLIVSGGVYNNRIIPDHYSDILDAWERRIREVETIFYSCVKSVNGQTPDKNGNVEFIIPKYSGVSLYRVYTAPDEDPELGYVFAVSEIKTDGRIPDLGDMIIDAKNRLLEIHNVYDDEVYAHLIVELGASDSENGYVKSVNGKTPDENGDVSIYIPGVILPETELESDMDGWYLYTFIPNVTAGNTYTVNYNGVPYECVGVSVNQGGLKGVGLGNTSILGGENTGEPFAMLVTSEETFNSTGLGVYLVKLSGDMPRTVGIYEKASNVDLTGVVKSVNGVKPDVAGNVEIPVGGTAVESVEPAENDIPKVFITGVKPTTKDDVLAEMEYISKTERFHAYLEIKCQGSSSMKYAKKNFTVKLYSDEARETKQKKVFKDWNHESNKFVLKANWIDHSHARNIVSARIWDEVVKSRANYNALPEEMRNSPKSGAIDGFPVKLYYNGTYEGLYTWNIGKDAWMWGMDEDNPNHALLACGYNDNGVLLDKAGNFRALWSGVHEDNWDIEVGAQGTALTNSLNALISCVMDTDDETFKATIGNYLDINSALDYYLYFWANAGLDSLENNMLLATYDGVKWICGAYDMDSVWGLHYTGKSFIATNFKCPDQYQGPYSLLWERITKLFIPELQARYAELRSGVLSYPNIVTHFERFMDVIGLDLYAEDLTIYTGIPSGSSNNIKQIRNYVRDRLAYVDAEVGAMTPPVLCTGISLDKSVLTFTAEGSQTLSATVTPDGCTESMVWVSSHPEIASISVNGNVCTVQTVANGNSTVTVTCGEYSASCSVAVSGMPEPVACTGITLDKTELVFNGEDSQTIVATVTPSDTTDAVIWNSNNTEVATVENGIVSAVGNGSAVITATCGNQSASCDVSVSGFMIEPVLWLRGSDFSNDLISENGDGSFFDAATGSEISFANFEGTANSGEGENGEIVLGTANTPAERFAEFGVNIPYSEFTFVYKGRINPNQNKKYLFLANGTGSTVSVIFGYVANTVELYSDVDIRTGSQIAVNDGLEHTIVYAYDGDKVTGYLDGVKVVDVTKGKLTFATANEVFMCCDRGQNVHNTAQGAVKHIKFYDVALSEEEIQTVLSQI